MLHIKEIGKSNAQLQNSKLQTTKLWHKTTNNVFPLDLEVYLAQSKLEGNYDAAIRDIEELQRMTIVEMLNGKVNDAPYLSYSIKNKVRMTHGEFACMLHFSGIPADRQKAILFSLETGMKTEDVVTLTWGIARKMPMTSLAKAIIESFPRSINVNYVFWERYEDFGMVGPMFGLSQDFQDLFQGMSHREVWKLFHEAAPVNSFEDAASFQQVIDNITIPRIN